MHQTGDSNDVIHFDIKNVVFIIILNKYLLYIK